MNNDITFSGYCQHFFHDYPVYKDAECCPSCHVDMKDGYVMTSNDIVIDQKMYNTCCKVKQVFKEKISKDG